MRQVSYDKEKVSMNLAKLKSHGEDFEVVIEPDAAIKVRHGEADVKEALKAQHIYKDAMKGELVNEELLLQIFKTSDIEAVAFRIIKEGELHFNDDYKEELRNRKKGEITRILTRDAAHAVTGEAVNERQIHAALSQSKVTIDLYKAVADQIPEIIQKIRSHLPLTLERKTLAIRIPASFAPKLYGLVSSKCNLLEEAWLSEGSYSCKAELAAGAVAGLIDELKKATHGNVEVSILQNKK